MKNRIWKLFLLTTILALPHISCAKKPLEEQFEDAIYHPKKVNIRTLEKILDKGCPVDYLSYGETPLYSMCYMKIDNENEVMDFLIKKGADVNFSKELNDASETALLPKREKDFCITNCNSPEKVELLVSNGASVDADCGNGVTPLVYYTDIAANSDESLRYRTLLRIIEVLLENGADANHRLENNVTPLVIALQYEKRDLVDLLMRHGAEIHEDFVKIRKKEYKHIEVYDEYLFSELTSVFSSGYVDLIKDYLESHDVDLFSDIGNGLDYFCCAVISDKPEMVKLVLPYYGNINSRRYTLVELLDKIPIYGFTLYGIADAYGCRNSERTLLEHGADGFLHY